MKSYMERLLDCGVSPQRAVMIINLYGDNLDDLETYIIVLENHIKGAV